MPIHMHANSTIAQPIPPPPTHSYSLLMQNFGTSSFCFFMASCLDILPDQCEQGDEEDLMYKPFPDCCPVYCNLKRRMQRLRTMHLRHRLLRNLQDSVISAAAAGSADGNTLLSEIGYNY